MVGSSDADQKRSRVLLAYTAFVLIGVNAAVGGVLLPAQILAYGIVFTDGGEKLLDVDEGRGGGTGCCHSSIHLNIAARMQHRFEYRRFWGCQIASRPDESPLAYAWGLRAGCGRGAKSPGSRQGLACLTGALELPMLFRRR